MPWMPRLEIPAWLRRILPVERSGSLRPRSPKDNRVRKPSSGRCISPAVSKKPKDPALRGARLGRHVADLLRRLATNELAVHENQKEISDRQEEQLIVRSALDGTLADLLRLELDTRMDFQNQVNSLNALKGYTETDLRHIAERLSILKVDKAHLSTEKDSLWHEAYGLAQEYVNTCLDADFARSWSLSEPGCMEFRVLLDRYTLILHNTDQLKKLRYRMTILKNEQWRTKRFGASNKPRKPLGIGLQLERDEDATNLQEIETLKQEIDLSEETQALRSKRLETFQRDFLRINVTLDLSSASSGSHSRSTHRAGSSAGQPVVSEHATSSDHAPVDETSSPAPTDSRSSHHSSSVEDESVRLRAEYIANSERLVGLQKKYAFEVKEIQRRLTQHLLVFTNSSVARFETLTQRDLIEYHEAMAEAEGDLESSRQMLIDNDIDIPKDASPSPEPVVGGGLSDSSEADDLPRSTFSTSSRKAARDLKRMNRWRTTNEPRRPPDTQSPRSLASLAEASPRSRASASVPRSETRAKRLAEYAEQQGNLRA